MDRFRCEYCGKVVVFTDPTRNLFVRVHAPHQFCRGHRFVLYGHDSNKVSGKRATENEILAVIADELPGAFVSTDWELLYTNERPKPIYARTIWASAKDAVDENEDNIIGAIIRIDPPEEI